MRREYAKQMGVKGNPIVSPQAYLAELKHVKVQHPEETPEQHEARAWARVAYRIENPKKLGRFRKALVALLLGTAAFGQVTRTDIIRVNGSPVPSDGIRVNCVTGCSSSGGGLTDAQLRATPIQISGTFWQSTQPISGTVSVTNFSLLATESTLAALSAKLPASLVGGRLDVNVGNTPTVTIGNASIVVTGTFWQATQPISGTVGINNFPASQAVTGTFFQATQPVSIASMPSTPVTGTFWQVTQPVSIASTLNVNCASGCSSPTVSQTYMVAVVGTAATASKDLLNLFNGVGSGKVIRIMKIAMAQGNAAAVTTGLVSSIIASRTSTAGATCTAVTPRLLDSTNAAVPAQVTAGTNCTTDPTVTWDWKGCHIMTEESAAVADEDFCYVYEYGGKQPITLREGEGILLKTTALNAVGAVTINIEFTM